MAPLFAFEGTKYEYPGTANAHHNFFGQGAATVRTILPCSNIVISAYEGTSQGASCYQH